MFSGKINEVCWLSAEHLTKTVIIPICYMFKEFQASINERLELYLNIFCKIVDIFRQK